jgi:outer membrane protein assembly factor BamB
VISNGRVFLGGNDGKLACFDLSTRSLAWDVSTGESGSISSIVCPSAEVILVSSDDGWIYRVSSADGRISNAKRYFQRGSGLGMHLLAGVLIVRAANEVWAIRTQDLSALWKRKLEQGCWINELACDAKGIFSVVECQSASNGQRVMRFDPSDGQEKLLYEQTGPLYWPLCLLSDGVAVSKNSGVMVLDRQMGKKIWEKELKFPASNMFAVGQRIYALNDKSVICLDAEKGEILATQDGLLQPECAIATERLLIVVSRDLSVSCYELQ